MKFKKIEILIVIFSVFSLTIISCNDGFNLAGKNTHVKSLNLIWGKNNPVSRPGSFGVYGPPGLIHDYDTYCEVRGWVRTYKEYKTRVVRSYGDLKAEVNKDFNGRVDVEFYDAKVPLDSHRDIYKGSSTFAAGQTSIDVHMKYYSSYNSSAANKYKNLDLETTDAKDERLNILDKRVRLIK